MGGMYDDMAGFEEEEEAEGGEDEDETHCIFCNAELPRSKTEQDLHYFETCPILYQCPFCNQV